VPADTFDNVNGQFPIGFHIWNTDKKEKFKEITADVFDKNGMFIDTKIFSVDDSIKSMNKWIKKYEYKNEKIIGYMPNPGPDIQHSNQLFIQSKKGGVHLNYTPISKSNIIQVCIYFAVRQCIPATWLNDRDQFFYPNEGWENDEEFQSDCLAYTLFHGQNNISSKHGINHWIPFIEWDVAAHEKFDSHFMTDFINGKIEWMLHDINLFCSWNVGSGGNSSGSSKRQSPAIPKELRFSSAAKKVFKAGLKLWKYYHAQPKCNVNASLYDIREHFQSRNAKGKMNNKSDDETYNKLIGDLRSALKELANKIEPKVYEHGFLRG